MGGDTVVGGDGEPEVPVPATQDEREARAATRIPVNGPFMIAYAPGADSERIADDLMAQCERHEPRIYADAVPLHKVVLNDAKIYAGVCLVLPDDLGRRGPAGLAPFEGLLRTFRRQRPLGIEAAYADPSLYLKIGVVTLIAPRAILGLRYVLERFVGVDVTYSSDEESIDLFAVYDGWVSPTAGHNSTPQVGEILGNAWTVLRRWGCKSLPDADRLLVAIDRIADEYFEQTCQGRRAGSSPAPRFPQLGPGKDRPNALRRVLVDMPPTAPIGSSYRKGQVEDLARAVNLTLKLLRPEFPWLSRPRAHKSPVVEFHQLYVNLGTVLGLSQPNETQSRGSRRSRRSEPTSHDPRLFD